MSEFKDSNGTVLKKGDLIEFKRGNMNSHWAIYHKNGYGFHVIVTTKEPNGTLAIYDARETRVALVKRENLITNLINDSEFYVNNLHDGHCKPFPSKEIIKRAKRCIDKPYDYNFIKNNTEYFACKMRYDIDVTIQSSCSNVCEWEVKLRRLALAALICSFMHEKDD